MLFRQDTSEITIDLISKTFDMPKSTTYRYVGALVDAGFLERTATGRYRLGIVFLELSQIAFNSHNDLRQAALPSMRRLNQAIGESVSVTRLIGKHIVHIESIEGVHTLRIKVDAGTTLPLHAGASGRVMLAHLPEDEWKDALIFPLKKYTDYTITDCKILRENLRLVAQQGYAVSDGEVNLGTRSVAVPIFDKQKRVLASITMLGPSSRMDGDVIEHCLDLLNHERAIIQQKLK